jgi:hypothetical protein
MPEIFASAVQEAHQAALEGELTKGLHNTSTDRAMIT